MKWLAIAWFVIAAATLAFVLMDNGPQVGSVGAYDSDGDGWSDGYELYMGTSPLSACVRDDVDPSVEGFPPDFNNNGFVDTADMQELVVFFDTEVGPYLTQLRRYDIQSEPLGSGAIDTGDMSRVTQYFGTHC